MGQTFVEYLKWEDEMKQGGLSGQVLYNPNPHFANNSGYYTIVESIYMTDTREGERKRSWSERLLTFPWRPWKATAKTWVQVPKTDIMVVQAERLLIMHPTVAREFREAWAERTVR